MVWIRQLAGAFYAKFHGAPASTTSAYRSNSSDARLTWWLPGGAWRGMPSLRIGGLLGRIAAAEARVGTSTYIESFPPCSVELFSDSSQPATHSRDPKGLDRPHTMVRAQFVSTTPSVGKTDIFAAATPSLSVRCNGANIHRVSDFLGGMAASHFLSGTHALGTVSLPSTVLTLGTQITMPLRLGPRTADSGSRMISPPISHWRAYSSINTSPIPPISK